jgi:hypothetical protein
MFSPFSALLSTPPIFYPILGTGALCAYGATVQQTILYIPPSIHPQNFITFLDITYDTICRKSLIQSYRCVKMPGLVDFEGRQCQILMIFVIWDQLYSDHNYNILTNYNAGVIEMVRKKSTRWSLFGDQEDGATRLSKSGEIVGVEERNCKFFL